MSLPRPLLPRPRMAPPVATRCVASAPAEAPPLPSVFTTTMTSGRSAAREIAYQDRPSVRRWCVLPWCWQEPVAGRYCEAHGALMGDA